MALSFLKKGKDAQDEMSKADIQSDIRRSQIEIRRFWIKEGLTTDTQITFLDGALSSDGLIDTTRFWEHRVFMAGSWRNFFPCTAENEPCPICTMPKHFPSLVSLFTVIDHSSYTDRNGKTYKNQRKLFVAKRDTMKRLQKLASKRGGLKGWTLNVSRTGAKSAEVGTDFEFLEQRDLNTLAQTLGIPQSETIPFDYADGKTIRYLTADQLRSLGLGSHIIGSHDTSINLGAGTVPANEAMDREM